MLVYLAVPVDQTQGRKWRPTEVGRGFLTQQMDCCHKREPDRISGAQCQIWLNKFMDEPMVRDVSISLSYARIGVYEHSHIAFYIEESEPLRIGSV
jgi:hypothetical protein